MSNTLFFSNLTALAPSLLLRGTLFNQCTCSFACDFMLKMSLYAGNHLSMPCTVGQWRLHAQRLEQPRKEIWQLEVSI